MPWAINLVASHPLITAWIALHLVSTAYVLFLMAQSDREFAMQVKADSRPADLTAPISSAFLAQFARSAALTGNSTLSDFEIAEAA